MLSHIYLSITVIFWFPKVPMSCSHLSNPSRRRRPSGGSGKRSSNYSHTHTPLRRKARKSDRCGQRLRKQQHFQLRPDVISAMCLRACGTSSAAQRRNCFYVSEIPGQPTLGHNPRRGLICRCMCVHKGVCVRHNESVGCGSLKQQCCM